MKDIFNLPNGLSFLRIVLTPLFLYCASTQQKDIAFIILFIAGLTDWADGFFARFLSQESRFGQILDPVADKILLVSSYIGFYLLGFIPFSLMLVVVGRDLLLISAGLVILQQKLDAPMLPSKISKLNTVVQIMHIGIILLSFPTIVVNITEKIVFLTTLLSGFAYALGFYLWYTKKS